MTAAMRSGLADDCVASLGATGAATLAPLRGTHLVVTGGTGFVGSWVAAMVATLNDRFGFDMRLTAIARGGPQSLARQLASRRDDFRVLTADVRQLIELPRDAAWVVHAAGTPDNRFHATDPVETVSAIADGTARVLALAANLPGLRRLLHLSSGLVGQPSDRVSAAQVYVEAKRFSEALCAAHRTQNRTPVVVTRPFTFIGPFQRLDAPWAINNFLYAALNGQPLKILGSGDSLRASIYGSDVAALLLVQMVAGTTGETYDLGGATALPLLALAQAVLAEAKRPLEIRINTGGRDLGVSRLVPEFARSATALGFATAFDTASAIRRTLAWHQAERRTADAA